MNLPEKNEIKIFTASHQNLNSKALCVWLTFTLCVFHGTVDQSHSSMAKDGCSLMCRFSVDLRNLENNRGKPFKRWDLQYSRLAILSFPGTDWYKRWGSISSLLRNSRTRVVPFSVDLNTEVFKRIFVSTGLSTDLPVVHTSILSVFEQ